MMDDEAVALGTGMEEEQQLSAGRRAWKQGSMKDRRLPLTSATSARRTPRAAHRPRPSRGRPRARQRQRQRQAQRGQRGQPEPHLPGGRLGDGVQGVQGVQGGAPRGRHHRQEAEAGQTQPPQVEMSGNVDVGYCHCEKCCALVLEDFTSIFSPIHFQRCVQ